MRRAADPAKVRGERAALTLPLAEPPDALTPPAAAPPRLPALWRWRGLAEAALDRPCRVGKAARALAQAGWPAEHPAGLDLLMLLCSDERAAVEAAVSALPPEEAERPGVRLLQATCATRAQRLDEAFAVLPALVDRARLAGDEQLLAWALASYALACSLAGRRVDSYEALNQSIAVARSIGHQTLLALGLCNLGYLYGQDHRPEPYAAQTAAALALFEQLGDPQGSCFCLANLGGALVELGELARAQETLHAGRRRARAAGWTKIEAICLAGLGGLAFRRGHPAIAELRYAASERLLTELGELHGVCRQRLLMAGSLLDAGWVTEASVKAKAAEQLAAARGYLGLQLEALRLLADVHAASGDFEGAYRAMLRHASAHAAELEARVADAQAAGARLQAEREARRRAAWERERAEALELKNRELASALVVQRALRDELERASRTDPLTQLANRRAFDEALRWTLLQAARRGQPCSLLLIDADHFKQVNDTFGHAVGDEVLVELARRVAARARGSDLVARWGGEELCALLPDTDAGGALELAGALLEVVRGQPIATRAGPLRLTVSLGVATAAGIGVDPQELLRRADEALYRAKANGRDQAAQALPLAAPLHSRPAERTA